MLLRYQGILMSGSFNHGLLVTSFSPPTTAIEGSSAALYGRDGTSSPREWLGESSWVWTTTTNVQTLQEALALAGGLESAWKDPGLRNSTSHGWLEYSNDGGATWFRVYGRPGRFTSFTPDIRAVHGVGSMDLEFIQRDPLHYSNTEHSTTITLTSGTGTGSVQNDGNRDAPLAATFRGPCTNPTLRRNGMYFGYRGTLASNQSVRIDAQNQSVTLGSGGANPVPVPGGLTPRYSLTEFTAKPGRTDWTFEASGANTSTRAVMSWRDAHASMQYGGGA